MQLVQNNDDFTETDISNRTDRIIYTFMDYLSDNDLLQ